MRRKSVRAMLGALLWLVAAVRLQAAVNISDLKAMVIVSFDSYDRVMQRASLGFQGAGFPEGYAVFRRLAGDLLLVPDLTGLDRQKPIHFFLLTPDPPDSIPIPALVLPLADNRGESFLAALNNHYGEIARRSGVTTFTAPKDPSTSPFLSVAVAEEHALVSSRVDALRWLALHRRDRTLPAAGELPLPLRITAKGELLGLFVQLFAALTAGDKGDTPSTPLDVSHHLNEAGNLLSAFKTVDLGLDAGIREFAFTLRLNAAPESPLARKIGEIPTPAPDFERLLPMPVLNGEVSGLPALLSALPPSTTDWLESLAEATQLLGLRMAPRTPGWLPLLVPMIDGNYASAVLRTPRGDGLCSVQIFGFENARKAQAALSILEGLLPVTEHAEHRILPLEPRTSGTRRIVGYRLGEPAATNGTAVGSMGEVLTQLLRMNVIEMTRRDDHLIVVRGASTTLDELLDTAPVQHPAFLAHAAYRAFPPLRSGERLLGAGQLAPVATLRALADILPVFRSAAPDLPLPGGALYWRATGEGASLVWQLAVPCNEIMACSKLRDLDAGVLQELLSQFVLEQFNRSSAEQGQKEVLKERLRRMSAPAQRP